MLTITHICANFYAVLIRVNRYIYCFTVFNIPEIATIKEHLIRIYMQKDSSLQQVLLCTLWYVIC